MINPHTTEQIIVRGISGNIGLCQIYDTYRGHYMKTIPLNPKWIEDHKDKLSELNGNILPKIYYDLWK